MKERLKKRTKRFLVLFLALTFFSPICRILFDNELYPILCILLAVGLMSLFNKRTIEEIVNKLDEK